MKIKTSEPLVDLAGETIQGPDKKDFTVGQAIANILVSAKEGGKMKMFILAQDCYKKKEIELDQADLSLVKKAIDATEIYSNLITGQLLVKLEEAKK